MFGTFLGDIAGSYWEFRQNRVCPNPLFSRNDFFTDDSVLTMALIDTMRQLIREKRMDDVPYVRDLYRDNLCHMVWEYPNSGYGERFLTWATIGFPETNPSKGNGCAMKSGPMGFAFDDDTSLIAFNRIITGLTHDTPEALKATECQLRCILRARKGATKVELADFITQNYYPLAYGSYASLQKTHVYTMLAEETVPPALYCFLCSTSFEDALSKAVSIGGDADTLAAIVGPLAEAFYGFSEKEFADYRALLKTYLPPIFLEHTDDFYATLIAQGKYTFRK